MYDPAQDWVDTYEIVDPEGRLIEEFRAKPIGFRSAELQRVLLKMQIDPRCPNYVLFCRTPHKEWLIGRMAARPGDPVVLEEDRVFSSVEEAEWEVFRRRWTLLTGQEIA
ncbi:MAG: hypothetical protein RID42_08905 [Alphaproteobacteria bacterium]